MVRMIAAGLVLIGVLVIVHELGHYLVARFFGVGAPVFSIGMGPRIFGFRHKGTDFRISMLPVGGYVQLAGADPFGEEDADANVPDDENFAKKPLYQRFLIIFAGPAVNLVLPFVLFSLLYMVGNPEPSSRIATVYPDSPAAEWGMRSGDRIVAVNGEPVEVWFEVQESLEDTEGEPGVLTLERDGTSFDVAIPEGALLATVEGEPDLVSLGITRSVRLPMVSITDPQGPAAQAGMQTGDGIGKVDGEDMVSWEGLISALSAPGAHELEVVRPSDDGQEAEKHAITLQGGSADPMSRTTPWGFGPSALVVQSVADGSAAQAAGLQSGDELVSINGVELFAYEHLLHTMKRSYDPATHRIAPVEVGYLRDGERHMVSLTPALEVVSREVYPRPVMGVRLSGGQTYPSSDEAVHRYGIFQAISRGTTTSVGIIRDTGQMLVNMVTAESSVRESVGGPVAIFRVAAYQAERGIFKFLETIAVLSVSLGIINLLPVPALDGGQILFYAVEGLRGRPLSIELRERIQMLGVMMLVVFMLLITADDISDAIAGRF